MRRRSTGTLPSTQLVAAFDESKQSKEERERRVCSREQWTEAKFNEARRISLSSSFGRQAASSSSTLAASLAAALGPAEDRQFLRERLTRVENEFSEAEDRHRALFEQLRAAETRLSAAGADAPSGSVAEALKEEAAHARRSIEQMLKLLIELAKSQHALEQRWLQVTAVGESSAEHARGMITPHSSFRGSFKLDGPSRKRSSLNEGKMDLSRLPEQVPSP
jgi:hypothetical protein